MSPLMALRCVRGTAAFCRLLGKNGHAADMAKTVVSEYCDVPELPKPFELVDVLKFRTLPTLRRAELIDIYTVVPN
jgi:hypothetical protein